MVAQNYLADLTTFANAFRLVVKSKNYNAKFMELVAVIKSTGLIKVELSSYTRKIISFLKRFYSSTKKISNLKFDYKITIVFTKV